MTALVPTNLSARIVWLGVQRVPVQDLVITPTPDRNARPSRASRPRFTPA